MQVHHYFFTFLIAALFFLIIGLPVTADDDIPPLVSPDQRFSHTIQFNIGGRITIDRELGHECTTGAVKRTRVRGYGDMTKSESVRIAGNIMAIDEKTDWTTADDAVRNLSVITTIELCHRPMSAAAATYSNDDYDIEQGDIINPYDPLVVRGTLGVSSLTRQLWSTYVSANPGEEASYQSDFIAAYGPGPYEELYGAVDPEGRLYFYDEDYMWEYDPRVVYHQRDNRLRGYNRGDYYVGNYFNIDQYAYTSGGELSRFISISSPFTNALLEEDMIVIGMAEVRESFDMHNLEGGPKAVTLKWYDLF